MALQKAQDFLGSESPLDIHERIENDRLTGLVEYRVGEASIQGYKNAISQFLEVSYIVPELSKKDEKKLSEVLKKINKSSYAVRKVTDDSLKRMGLNTVVTVPFAGTRESKNLENISRVNEVLRFPDYENSVARFYNINKRKDKT
jgi:hypothetical protein